MLTQEDKMNLELKKKIKIKKKTTLPSLINQDWNKVQVGSEKVNKLLPNSPTGNITELNELFYTWAKLICNKIGVPGGNPTKIKTWIGN